MQNNTSALESVHDEIRRGSPDEASQAFIEDLDRERDDQTKNHGLRLSETFFTITTLFVWIGFILFSFTIVVWSWHQLTPLNWKWLDEKEIHNLERILFASALISVGGKYLGKFKLMEK